MYTTCRACFWYWHSADAPGWPPLVKVPEVPDVDVVNVNPPVVDVVYFDREECDEECTALEECDLL
jgi:hypothetical protein